MRPYTLVLFMTDENDDWKISHFKGDGSNMVEGVHKPYMDTLNGE